MYTQPNDVDADQAHVTDLRRAIDGDELVVHYQPKLSLTDRRVYGFEALVRWAHPTRGLVGPGEFVLLACAQARRST